MGIFNIRLYLETESEVDCESVIDKIRGLIPPSAKEKNILIKQYWKIEDYMEVELTYDLEEISEEQLKAICESLAVGWEFEELMGELSAMWNFKENITIKIDNLKWALVTFLPKQCK